MTDLTSKGWAYRLVAMWCKHRARDSVERKQVQRCRSAYKAGSLVAPVNRFADLLERQGEANAAEWRALEAEMLAAAEREAGAP